MPLKNPGRICAVIPVFYPEKNRLYKLISGLDPFRAVIINNSRETLRLPSNSWEIRPSVNTGYARGANLGIRQAMKNGAMWVAVMNQDLVLSGSAWVTVINYLKILQPCLAGPFVGTLDPVRWTTQISESSPETKVPMFDYISGSFMLIHRDVLERTGMFYEPFFMYYEDADLSLRVREKGMMLEHIPLAGISHPARGSNDNPLKEYYLARNHVIFMKRHAPFGTRFREFIRLPKTILDHRRNGNALAVRGVLDAYLGKFGPMGGSR